MWRYAAVMARRVASHSQYGSLLPIKPGWSNRTSYVIAPSGKIVHVYSELKPAEHVKQTLDAVKALGSTKG
jgi:peroxiredoxin